ncbi:MAG: glycerophosphodiester phosphodiesterase [Actinomycetota bacterium]|nr:glycerophosphodiester phosphodiesterase [Actinomycetota bacterium]
MGNWVTGKNQLIAHKGNSWEFPENSKASVKSAIDLGCHVVEIDVSLTRDGYTVALHGPKLDEMTTGQGKVSKTNLDTIKTLKVKDGKGVPTIEPVPLLEDLLSEFSTSIRWNLDLKAGLPSKKLMRTISELGIGNQVIFSGLGISHVKKLASSYPEANVVVNLSRIDRAVLALRIFNRIYLQLRFRSLKSIPSVVGINANHRSIGNREIEIVHGLGFEIWVYTVDDHEKMLSLFDANVDSVTTNKPSVMIQAIRTRLDSK